MKYMKDHETWLGLRVDVYPQITGITQIWFEAWVQLGCMTELGLNG